MTVLIRCADGSNYSTQAPVRVIPREGFSIIQVYDHGVWEEQFTTPFAVEVEVRP
jgi:hypothetical protein